jgi:pyruvate/2-oxoglutarate dehydrogenase complex dihydrolipoamide dehydrogenase (E3) component
MAQVSQEEKARQMPKRIVIIGAHAAGVDAASAARKTDHTAEITLLTEEAHPVPEIYGLLRDGLEELQRGAATSAFLRAPRPEEKSDGSR